MARPDMLDRWFDAAQLLPHVLAAVWRVERHPAGRHGPDKQLAALRLIEESLSHAGFQTMLLLTDRPDVQAGLRHAIDGIVDLQNALAAASAVEVGPRSDGRCDVMGWIGTGRED